MFPLDALIGAHYAIKAQHQRAAHHLNDSLTDSLNNYLKGNA
ncbi:hypothetical protein KUC_2720 [Vreelandella boliviensis LC1]|uniref:Uncharacterized protein n=1 Tax=Vreelandella boliviensis LC1 TaxID=1072583 RepID=A0A7U9GFC9_9GAMM|nr:hypothetical protein KUC_2720 [Halomonas boliviensis LC1]